MPGSIVSSFSCVMEFGRTGCSSHSVSKIVLLEWTASSLAFQHRSGRPHAGPEREPRPETRMSQFRTNVSSGVYSGWQWLTPCGPFSLHTRMYFQRMDRTAGVSFETRIGTVICAASTLSPVAVVAR